jgi:hypothetical protein
MLQQRGLRGVRHDHVWSQNLRRNGPAVDGNRRPPPHHGETLTEGGIAFGKRVRDMDRVVVSTTMENAGHNVLLIRDDIAQRIIALKAHTGSDILLYCGPNWSNPESCKPWSIPCFPCPKRAALKNSSKPDIHVGILAHNPKVGGSNLPPQLKAA